MHPVALEERVLFHLDEDVKITRGAAAQPRLTLTRQPDAGAGLDAWRNVPALQSPSAVASRCAQGAMDWTEPVNPWLITTPTSPAPMLSGRASGQTDGTGERKRAAMSAG